MMLNISANFLSKLHADHFLVRVAIVIVVGLLLYFSLRWVYAFICKRLEVVHMLWTETLMQAMYVPLQLTILVSTIFYLIIELSQHYKIIFLGAIELVYELCLLGFVLAAALLFVQKVEGKLIARQKKRMDLMAIKSIVRLSHLAIIMLGVLALLQILGIPLSAVVAFGGIGGVAVGFASKDLVANLLGGFMIFTSRPFAIGDEIKLQDRNLEGVIEQISWRQSVLRTHEQRLVYIPNSVLSTVLIENISRMRCRRILFDVAINLDDFDKMPKICEALELYLDSRQDIDHSLICFVKFVEVKDGGANLRVWCYPMTKSSVEALQVQQEILMQLYQIVQDNNAHFSLAAAMLIPSKEVK